MNAKKHNRVNGDMGVERAGVCGWLASSLRVLSKPDEGGTDRGEGMSPLES